MPDWFLEHVGWKQATRKSARRCEALFGEPWGPNLADLSNETSARIAGRAYDIAGIPRTKRVRDPNETASSPAAGNALEVSLKEDILQSLIRLDADREWEVTRHGGAQRFIQYEHLRQLQELFQSNWTLRSTVGQDYQVSTDIMVSVPLRGHQGRLLHAAISSKLTIRSDRVQNIRFEFTTLVKNRRGRLPHLVVVTAEPLPSRLISIARGTGEIDAVYHLMFDEIDQALQELRQQTSPLAGQANDWEEIVQTRRLRPYSELPEVLASS